MSVSKVSFGSVYYITPPNKQQGKKLMGDLINKSLCDGQEPVDLLPTWHGNNILVFAGEDEVRNYGKMMGFLASYGRENEIDSTKPTFASCNALLEGYKQRAVHVDLKNIPLRNY